MCGKGCNGANIIIIIAPFFYLAVLKTEKVEMCALMAGHWESKSRTIK